VDWFERLTGLSPDGGSGAFEALVVAVVALALCCILWRVARHRPSASKRRWRDG
jgi:hypothetical protein